MNDFVNEAQRIYDQAKKLHTDMYSLIARSDNSLKKSDGFSSSDYVDFGILFRDIEDTLVEAGKEARARHELCGRMIAMLHTQETLQGRTSHDFIRGELGIATPKFEQQGKLPERGSPEYFDFLEFVGFPKEVIKKHLFADDDLPNPLKLSIDWNGLREWLTWRAAASLPIPPSIGKTYPMFSSVFRRSKKQPKIKR